MKPVKYQLKNGLTVLLVHSAKNPVVAVQAWVRTGSADETPREAGISHFIEHLLFKGTERYKVGEIASTIEGSGGELNAYTSFDQTVFHVTLPSSGLEIGLDVIAEMMGKPLFDKDEVDREREVVIEEIKRGQDSPGRCHSQLMFSTVFKKHTYRRPVIGFDKVIRSVSVPVLKRYFRDRYTPRNMFVMVCGDFDTKTIREKVANHFGGFESYPIRKVKRPREVGSRGRTVVKTSNFKESHVGLTWRTPSVKHKDVPALDVLALVLGQGDSSRLARRLRFEDAVVNSVGTSSYSLIDHGIFSVHLSATAAHLPEAVTACAEEIERLMREGPTAEELAKAVTALSSDSIYSMETVDGLARSFGSMEFYFHDPMAFNKYLANVQKLKISDIQKIAKKYLKPEGLFATALVEDQSPAARKALERFRKTFAAKKLAASPKAKARSRKLPSIKMVGPSDSSIEIVTIPGGGKLILRPQKETPTTSFRLVFGGGLFVEPIGKEGLNELLSRAWGAGSHEYPETKLNAEIEAMAAGFGTFSGRNTSGLNADFISTFEDRIWNLTKSVVLSPSLDEAVFERERNVLGRQIALRKDNPAHQCMRAFAETLFAGHPYAKDAMGTAESLQALTIDQVRAQKNVIFTRENLSMAVVGDIDRNEWVDRAHRLAEALPKGKSLLTKVEQQKLTEDIRVFRKLDKEQTHLLVGMKALSVDDPKRWTLHVLQSILAGQGGRLFLELRDKESLAYSVSPVSLEGYGAGSFGVYIACSPEKRPKAEQMIHDEHKKLREKLVDADELDRAIRYLCGRGLIDLQRKSAQANSILFDTVYGNNPEDGLLPNRHYEKVTAEEVRALAEELFSQKTVTSVAGPYE